MSDNTLRDDATESPLQKRRRLDAEGAGPSQVEPSASGGEPEASSSSSTLTTPPIHGLSTTPAGSPSSSGALNLMLSPILAPAPEPAPPVVTTDVAVARAPSQPEDLAEPSFVRGTLQDPEVRSLIDNLGQLQRQMRNMVNADSSSTRVINVARRMMITIEDMESALRSQHTERLNNNRAQSERSNSTRPPSATARGSQWLFSDIDTLWNSATNRPSQHADRPPLSRAIDLETERRRLNERIRSLNDLTARLYSHASLEGEILPIPPLPVRREATPPAQPPLYSWTNPDASEDRWTRERQRRRELEHALLDESYSILPALRPSGNDAGSSRWERALDRTRVVSSPAPPSTIESRVEARLREFSPLHREPELDPMPDPYPPAYPLSASDRGAGGWEIWPMDVDEEPPSLPLDRGSVLSSRDETPVDVLHFGPPLERSADRRERSATPAGMSRSATLPVPSMAARIREGHGSSGRFATTHRGAATPIESASRASSVRPFVEQETSPEGMLRAPSVRSDDLTRRRDILARRREWHLQLQRVSSRPATEPSRRDVLDDASASLPGIQELFGPASPAAPSPNPSLAWAQPWYSPSVITPRSSSARGDPASTVEEELQDIAETIRLLEDDGSVGRAGRPVQQARNPSWQERAAMLREQMVASHTRQAAPPRDRPQPVGGPGEGTRTTRTAEERVRAYTAMRERAARERERQRAAGRAPFATQVTRSGHPDLEHRAMRSFYARIQIGTTARGTPEGIIDGLPSGTYGEWARPGESEEHCPICFEDWTENDMCLRMPNCTHWFHKPCLVRWLQTARTCPTCRAPVEAIREPDRTRDAFGRPRVRITTGGTAPLAVRARNPESASSSAGEVRVGETRAGEREHDAARRLPPVLRVGVDVSDDEDTVLVERRRRSQWSALEEAGLVSAWRGPEPAAAAGRAADEPWREPESATTREGGPASTSDSVQAAWNMLRDGDNSWTLSLGIGPDGWSRRPQSSAWGAPPESTTATGASGSRTGGAGGAGDAARNTGDGDGNGNGNGQSGRGRGPWSVFRPWPDPDRSW